MSTAIRHPVGASDTTETPTFATAALRLGAAVALIALVRTRLAEQSLVALAEVIQVSSALLAVHLGAGRATVTDPASVAAFTLEAFGPFGRAVDLAAWGTLQLQGRAHRLGVLAEHGRVYAEQDAEQNTRYEQHLHLTIKLCWDSELLGSL